jgi:tetratricopeptide (TPR) repeat protein
MRKKWPGLFLLGVAVLPYTTIADEAQRKLDPKRIINESASFLKEREPDLTAEENALYEKASDLLAGKPDLALSLLEGIGAKSGPGASAPASPAFDLLLGNVYYSLGAIEKAEARYLSAVNRYPSFLRAWTNLGVLYYTQSQFKKAIPCLMKAVTLGDRASTTSGMMGFCLENTGDPIGAEVAYIQALAGDPGNVSWMEGLLRVYLADKQYARAEVMVRNLIKVNPSEPKYWLTYSKIMVATDRKLEAIALLEQTLSTGIAGEAERAELAGLYADEQLIPEAAQTYGGIKVTTQVLGPQNTLQLLRTLIASSEWDKAQALLNEIEPTFVAGGREEVLQVKADLFSARKQWGAAKDTLHELLRLAPMNGKALVSLGRVYTAEGDTVHATLAFEAAVQTREGVFSASVELATIELKNRHYEKSASYLEKALSFQKTQDLEDILTQVRTLVPGSERNES